MYSSNLSEKVKSAPLSPGCYIWKGSDGGVLYVGKAVNIRARASSYLNNYDRLDPKIRAMIDHAVDVEFYEVDSEVEALILETNLIKKYKPKYNRLMKDDKNYVWLKIDWYRKYPKLEIVREQLDKKAEYYGPYPVKFPVTKVLIALRKLYPYCDTPPHDDDKFLTKPCFNYHIGLCSGICAGKVSRLNHRKNINGIRNFFRGRKDKEVNQLKKKMLNLSQKHEFEKAAEIRDRLKDLEYVTQRIRITKEMDELLLTQEKIDFGTASQLELFKYLKKYRDFDKLDLGTTRIECFDISNIQGTNPTASMVVFVGGKMSKSNYKKFKIKSKQTPDDFAMMKEALGRRLKRIGQAGWEKPDLIIIDGGKGQLSSAYRTLVEYELDRKIAIVGLAKREEEIFYISDSLNDIVFEKIVLPRKSGSLYLIQRIRDEAHRFAIGYHRKLRSKGQVYSQIDDIPGVGKIVKKRLFDAFGSMANMSKKSFEELNSVIRNKKTAEAIFKIISVNE
jgi:excinuclease ABC subunit C